MFSVGNENSDVTKINENGSGEVSEETAFIMNRAMQVSKETKGAFDITIYPVMELWGFTTKNYRVPEHSEIAEVLKHVSYTNVGINGQQVTLSDGESSYLGVLSTADKAVITSGGYERYFE